METNLKIGVMPKKQKNKEERSMSDYHSSISADPLWKSVGIGRSMPC